MMHKIHLEDILAILRSLPFPRETLTLLDSSETSPILIKDQDVTVILTLPPTALSTLYEPARQEAAQKISQLAGVQKVQVILTVHQEPSAGLRPLSSPSPSASRFHLPEIRKYVAIASGKGGVGKSTTAVNLAFAFHHQGLRVGLLDADIYGPSLPRMMGLTGPPQTDSAGRLWPLIKEEIQCMSMGFLMPETTPAIWRGPMIQKSVQQFFQQVLWKEVDILIIDLPPGTGDAHLTLAQKVPLDGAIIVSTPQEIALSEAMKAIEMFKKLNIPILGIIENMSLFTCPHCGESSAIFSEKGGQEVAQKYQVPFLGSIPLDLDLRKSSDAGKPFVHHNSDHPTSRLYHEISKTLRKKLI